jgi:hypothetical protein
MRNYIGNTGAFQIRVPKALAAAVTVSFQTADADPANDCLPGATWTPLNEGGLCDAVTPMTYVADPLDAGYDPVAGVVCFKPIQCRAAFVRAVLSAASAGLTVDVVGPAQRQAEA